MATIEEHDDERTDSEHPVAACITDGPHLDMVGENDFDLGTVGWGDVEDVVHDTSNWVVDHIADAISFYNLRTDEKIVVEPYENGEVGVRSSHEGHIDQFDGSWNPYRDDEEGDGDALPAALHCVEEYVERSIPCQIIEDLDRRGDKEYLDDQNPNILKAQIQWVGDDDSYSLEVWREDRDDECAPGPFQVDLKCSNPVKSGAHRVAQSTLASEESAREMVEAFYDAADQLRTMSGEMGQSLDYWQ